MGNQILFPAPASTYNCDSDNDLRKRLVWIPEDIHCNTVQDKKNSAPLVGSRSKSRKFPALFYNARSPHTLLYFHGNSADLGDIDDEMETIYRYAGCNVLAIEFPGYGVCSNVSTNPILIDLWGRAAFNWLLRRGASPMGIIPFGRSIGTGPAAKLAASLKNEAIQTGGLILHSPYCSIHKIVADYTSLGTWLIGNHWDTEEALNILSPTTPLLVIHGENDEVIPVKHGKALYNGFKADFTCKEGFFPEDSPHNAYLIIDHLGVPIKRFLETKSLSSRSDFYTISPTEEDRKVPHEYFVTIVSGKSAGSSMEKRVSHKSSFENSRTLVVKARSPTPMESPSAPDPSFFKKTSGSILCIESDLAKDIDLETAHDKSKNGTVTSLTSSGASGEPLHEMESPRPSRSLFCSCYPEKSERCEVIIQ